MKKLLLFALIPLAATPATQDRQFTDSFIRQYDFCKQGRYSHEYHPFLLNKASNSMDELENYIEKHGISLDGRMVIAGYEEQAIPSYYTDYARPEITDEATQNLQAGCVPPPHNRFGLMTGFLFKDFNYYASQWWPQGNDPVFEHIFPELIEIYDGRGTIFQQDAFGDLYQLLMLKQVDLERLFYQGKHKEIMAELIHLWETMYKEESKSGNKQVVGTQDILFSVEYARHLLRSKLSLLKYWTGGDITYPIEVSLMHKKEATHKAQHFVQQFVPRLQPINNEPTAYIFCSFVDGVGKSTMLGNVKNWLNHGKKVEEYAHVDNSSSQFAEKFQVAPNVFICDLPAQVSHFTYKPDGLVYVEAKTLVQDVHMLDEVIAYVHDNKTELARTYYQSMLDTQASVFAQASSSRPGNLTPNQTFLRNVCMLKKQTTNQWIPFSFKNKHYLFNFFDIAQIRTLIPIEKTPSHGLKNIEPEQMLFNEGVKFPVSYQTFLDDLVDKLQSSGIKHVIFVDFLSMYPRSCRENIRVNYLLQQLAILHPDITANESIYGDVIEDSHLFYSLKNKGEERFADFLKKETLLRLGLYKIVDEQNRTELRKIGLFDIVDELKKKNVVAADDLAYLDALAHEKINSESDALEQTFGLTKEFVNIQQFAFEPVMAFSQYLEKCFSSLVDNKEINELWAPIGAQVIAKTDMHNGLLNKLVSFDTGLNGRGLFVFWPECKSAVALEPFMRSLRACWYATISNFMHTARSQNKKLMITKELYPVAPLMMRSGTDGKIYAVQPCLDEWKQAQTRGPGNNPENNNNDYRQKMVKKFGLQNSQRMWGKHNNKPYCLNWENRGTNEGLFAFDYVPDSSTSTKADTSSIVARIVKLYKEKRGKEKVMPTSILYEELAQSDDWHKEWQSMLNDASTSAKAVANNKNGETPHSQEPAAKKLDQKKKKEKRVIALGTSGQRTGAQLMVRALATLEMVAKDANAEIVVRKGNKQDFKAALKLIEAVVLPKYVGIIFEQPLWPNYDEVEPCIPWKVIGN